jgi:hypothetical protein
MPCEHCGASVARGDEHACDHERRLEFQLFALREEVAAFEEQLGAWLRTPEGAFACFYAARTRGQRLQRPHGGRWAPFGEAVAGLAQPDDEA